MDPPPWIDKEDGVEFTMDLEVKVPHSRPAAHALLYCKTDAVLFERIPMRYAIMMQLRFDGTLGFPGGYVSSYEDNTFGLNRELVEEMGLEEKYFFQDSDYYGSWIHRRMAVPLIDHFYVKEYSEKDYKKIEQGILQAHDWGGETMGIIRVPVSCYPVTDRPSPFCEFLLQNFVGNAQQQLVQVALSRGIFTEEDLLSVYKEKDRLIKRRRQLNTLF